MHASEAGSSTAVDAADVATEAGLVAVHPLVPTRSFDAPLTYRLPAELRANCEVGALVAIPVARATRPGIVAALDPPPLPGSTRLRDVLDVLPLPVVPAQLVELADWIAGEYGCSVTRALALVCPPHLAPHARASSLPGKRRLASMLRVVEEARSQVASMTSVVVPPHDVQLNDEQAAAVSAILAPTTAPASTATLIQGVTGSGKTEVYLEIIERELAAGRDAIVLVPEIALTPQTSRRFLQRFPGTVEVLHSALTTAQRRDAWLRIACGAARVVVGARSAVFAPMQSLGVIIIDEEHDGSYKQESEPRYDARRVAYKRAALAGARLILGSATPRIESWHGVADHVQLRQRAQGGKLAPVRLVDLRASGDDYPLTATAKTALERTLARGSKAIVLHNRRGYAGRLRCGSCGCEVRCTSCDVALTLHGAHGANRSLRCHHCGFSTPAPSRCPSCASASLARIGVGTERVERDIQALFDVPVLRMDADSTRARDSVQELLTKFATPGAKVLVGTQMVAKGHDFPDVELALVVDADTSLSIPDFRSEERSFDLVCQVAGRAGRHGSSAQHSRVIVQSWDVEAPWIGRAQEHDINGFLRAELARRERFRWPPFSRLARVVVSSPHTQRSDIWAAELHAGLNRLAVGEVLGPAPLMRVGGRERRHILVRGGRIRPVVDAMRSFLQRTERDRERDDVRVVLDIDPNSLL